MCGEKPRGKQKSHERSGSPPRVRGKVRPYEKQRNRYGITPACAGKSGSAFVASFSMRDHPRVCGEKLKFIAAVFSMWGSPPRVRGKEHLSEKARSQRGITPACAGKRFSTYFSTFPHWDHPRVCGEKLYQLVLREPSAGSPPRVRGKDSADYSVSSDLGITPACAGKRLKRSHSIGHFSYILCLFHSVLHRASASGGSRAGPCAPPCLPAQNAVPV